MSTFFKKHAEKLAEDASHRGVPETSSEYEGRSRLDKAALIELDRIEADPQHREHFDEGDLEQLAQSLRDHGQLQPIRVRWSDERSKYVIIAGERRYRAAGIAGLPTIEAIVVSSELTDAQILREQILENTLRADLLPSEQATAFKDLMEKEGLNGKELAAYLRVAPSTISRTISVLDFSKEIREKVDSGFLSVKDAIKITKATGGGSGKAAKPKPKKKSKERKIVVGGYTVTVKARKILSDEILLEALRKAIAQLESESGDEQQLKAA